VTVEVLVGARSHARQPLYRVRNLIQVVGIPTELPDAIGEDAQDLDEFVVHLWRGPTEHAQLDSAQPVVD
jgi:hypothetical protein